MPRASTFYAGREAEAGRHVFVGLQHNQKAYRTGQFTVNIILSDTRGQPDPWRSLGKDAFGERRAGVYRLGTILHGRDKWWCLLPTEASRLIVAWRPSSYEDEVRVFREAIADLTSDVKRVLAMLGCPPSK